MMSYEDIKQLAEEVGKFTDLPKDEIPAVVTIADVAKMQDRSFFQKAKNGDKVLLYTNAAKAVLYDPIVKKVIDVAPINIGTQSAQEAPKESLPKVALRNGTQTVGLTAKIETKLKGDGVKFETASKENAEKQDYQNSVVVILNESAKDLAESIANMLDATVSDLPSGEIKPDDADVLVILGKDAT